VRRLRLVSDAFPGDPGLDAAVSRVLLERVADGESPETLRLYVPDRLVAFGSRDAVHPEYPRARRAAEAAGFGCYLRLAGGRAAVFHEHTIAFAWAAPSAEPRGTIEARFAEIGEILIEALGSLGVDARRGEIPGEYCPGSSSINAAGRTKLAGIGQRLIRGAAHVGGVLVVDRPDLVNRALKPVYGAFGYDWNPAATGAVASEVAADVATVAAAVRAAFAERHHLEPGAVDSATLDRARSLRRGAAR